MLYESELLSMDSRYLFMDAFPETGCAQQPQVFTVLDLETVVLTPVLGRATWGFSSTVSPEVEEMFLTPPLDVTFLQYYFSEFCQNIWL